MAEGESQSAALAAPFTAPERRTRSLSKSLRRVVATSRRWMLPVVFIVLLAKPAILTWIEGRDLEFLTRDMMRHVSFNPLLSTIGRIGTALILGFSALAFLAWFISRGRYLKRPARRRAIRLRIHWLLLAALGWYVASVLIPGAHEEGYQMSWQLAYVLVVIAALWFSRKSPRGPVLGAVQWTIAAIMIASLAISYSHPEMTMTFAGAEQRLPFAENRFWGLGSGPNSIAPLALVQLILQLYQPMRRNPLWIAANLIAAAAALTVLVWAQSQTTWAAAIAILPLLLIRRVLPRRISAMRLNATTMVVLLIGVVAGAALIGGELIASGTVSKISDAIPLERSGILDDGAVAAATTIGDELLTGRGQIWATAIDIWQDHPWFGYGLGAWSVEFRRYFGLPSALHAHNQFLQAMSVGGVVALVALVAYLVALGWFAWRTSGLSRGLTLGLLAMILIRMATEVPLGLATIDDADSTVHLLLLYLLFAYGTRWHGRRQISWKDGANRVLRIGQGKKRRRRRSGSVGGAFEPADGLIAGAATGGLVGVTRATMHTLGSHRDPDPVANLAAAANVDAQADSRNHGIYGFPGGLDDTDKPNDPGDRQRLDELSKLGDLGYLG